ncbi:MAG: cobyrinate a,c-diamide synthase [Thermoflexales bacterium]|nr:cobyrinate a,c-diamide synthase [Thermoflexales bacterium]
MSRSSTAVPTVIIAAPHSGSGKTTIAVGLIAALAARGLRVAPFKVGPDYIDPSLLSRAAGRPCYNLDLWMLGEEAARESFARRTADSDFAVVEGVMGLFDGVSGDDDAASTAHVARVLGAPVVLVLDASAMARTAAALVCGLREFDRRVNLAGVIFNRVGSPTHAQMLREAVVRHTDVRPLGSVLRNAALERSDRHLGLVPAAEDDPSKWIAAARQAVEAGVDLNALVEIAEQSCQCPLPLATSRRASQASSSSPVIAVAHDAAFNFIYPDNLELIEEAGGRVVFFSPLSDSGLPTGSSALILCGGYPELFAERLAANASMRAAIRHAAQSGMPIYAECGGLMYLCEALVDQQGRAYPMCGVLPGRSVMGSRLVLGYRTARAEQDCWLWRAGETVRGHEFHYSTWQADGSLPPLYTFEPSRYQREPRCDGARVGNVLASYLHLHFLAKPELAERIVHAAQAWRDATASLTEAHGLVC